MYCVHADTVVVACVRAGAINVLCTCRYGSSGMCAGRCDQCIVYMQIR